MSLLTLQQFWSTSSDDSVPKPFYSSNIKSEQSVGIKPPLGIRGRHIATTAQTALTNVLLAEFNVHKIHLIYLL